MNHINKLISIFILLFFIANVNGAAQMPNSDFESWSSGNPVNWFTSNVPSVVTNITQTADALLNASAVKGAVVLLSTFAFPPVLNADADGMGFAVNAQHPALHGWYKYFPVGGDIALAPLGMTQAGGIVGEGLIVATDTQSVYRELVIDITYFSATIPETCIVNFSINNETGPAHVGSNLYLDDLTFGPMTGVDEHGNALPGAFKLEQNYPNPFNPTTMIQYAIPQAAHVQLRMFDVLGREVALLVNGRQEAGSYRERFDGSSVRSGVYYNQLTAAGYSSVKKFMLVK